MKKILLLTGLLWAATLMSFAQTPLSMNGSLKLVGNQLSNECGDPVQLRGMSTHGVMFHQNCYSESSVQSLAQDWGSDLIRLAIYTESEGGTDGYIDGDRDFWHSWIDNMVTYAEEQGIYVVIDWHILHDGNPQTHKAEAIEFFELMSQRYADKSHVIYEICNEPNGGTNWGTIKSYAQEVIPVIRSNDSEGIILVGTPEWSSDIWAAANDPLTGSNAHNVMYTYHFYAGSHYGGRLDALRTASGEIPVFVSEWGTVPASGDGGVDFGNADNWTSLMDGNNSGGVTISSANWSFVDKNEGASALTSGACSQNNWTSRTESGDYVYNYIQGGNNFTQCNSAADDDNDGVSNGNDECPGTPAGTTVGGNGCAILQGDTDGDGVIDADDLCANTAAGTTVNIHGCEIIDDFVSNVCVGYNNYQGYARHDFSEDSLANVDFWNRPEVENPVYSATTSDGELVIEVTAADPNYATMGFSFGEQYHYNGIDYDTTLTPLDIRAHPVLEMDVRFEGQGYASDVVLLGMELEDVDGNVVNTDGTGNVMRPEVSLGENVHITADFTDGYKESHDEEDCPDETPCLVQEIDFSRINKIKMWVNPGAGANWSEPEFTGTWTIDNFSIGYDEESAVACTEIRDDDEDGVKQEDDRCPGTPGNATVNASGCADFQLDDDNDGVMNTDDQCPATPEDEIEDVNERGCSPSEADDDQDGVLNSDDLCANTPAGEDVDEDGCSASQLDADGDGVPDTEDNCPETPAGAVVDGNGCSDTDGDGVPNNADLCANTAEGASVDENGCSDVQRNADDDEDGVVNGDDICPDTPSGESVNAEGCSDSQLDDDNDGVANAADECPGTPEGESVDLNGCSDSQLDDDNDGVFNSNDQCADTAPDAEVDENGCSYDQRDDDEDGTVNGEDECPEDPNKIDPEVCGCGVSEDDCTVDCAGVVDGEAYVDNCGECVGGTTGIEACVGDPYNGTPHLIPGIIQIEEYDLGGQDEGYFDTTVGKEGENAASNFRTEDDVDIELINGNYNLGYTEANEWLNYTVDIQATGTYNITFSIASGEGGEDRGIWHLELDGQELEGTTLNSVNTGDWQQYVEVTTETPVELQAGMHSLRFFIDEAGFNINYIEFEAESVLGVAPKAENLVDVYPVPASDMITVEQREMEFTNAVIMDVTGNIVQKAVLAGMKEDLRLEGLAKGVYFIQLSGAGRSETFRIVVQ